jgi:membrane associated rhomboid family serine protease
MNRQTYYRPPTQFSVFPPVIKNLLIINGLFFLAKMVAIPEQGTLLSQVLSYMALYPPGSGDFGLTLFGQQGQIPGFWPWQLVTYSFLHGGVGHILFNMFGLWMFGVQIENRWGSQRFAIFYFACVIGAAVLHLFMVSAAVPTVGASGGVFGVLLAFGLLFPNQPIYLYFMFPIKAKWLVTGLILLELFYGFSGSQTGVANFAHLGGALVGFIMTQYYRGKLPALKPDRN